jgi:hypothetical protein
MLLYPGELYRLLGASSLSIFSIIRFQSPPQTIGIDYEIEDYIKDNDGRFLICILKVNNEKTLLANYYGLNTDEIYLLEDFCNRIEQFNDMPIVCGG